MLLESMPYLMKQQNRPMAGPHHGPRGPYQGQKPNGMRPNNRGDYQNRMGGQRNPMHQMGGPGGMGGMGQPGAPVMAQQPMMMNAPQQQP